MRHIFTLYFLSHFLLPLFPFHAHAESLYITDVSQFSIRRGPSTEHKILYFLNSGQPVKILEQKNGWAHIQSIDTASQPVSGWILSRYLIQRMPHAQQITLLMEENEILKQQTEENRQACAVATENVNILEKNLAESEQALNQAKSSLEQLSRDSEGYLTLRQSCAVQKKENETLVHENTRLRSENQQKNMMLGGGLVFGGIFLGFMWGRREKQRSSGRLL